MAQVLDTPEPNEEMEAAYGLDCYNQEQWYSQQGLNMQDCYVSESMIFTCVLNLYV